MVSEVKKCVTWIGYFGPSTNVRDVRDGAPSTDSMITAIASLPKRESAKAKAIADAAPALLTWQAALNAALTEAFRDRPGVVLSFKRADRGEEAAE